MNVVPVFSLQLIESLFLDEAFSLFCAVAFRSRNTRESSVCGMKKFSYVKSNNFMLLCVE